MPISLISIESTDNVQSNVNVNLKSDVIKEPNVKKCEDLFVRYSKHVRIGSKSINQD